MCFPRGCHSSLAVSPILAVAFAESSVVGVKAKIKLRQFAGDAGAGGLCGGHLELDFAATDRLGEEALLPRKRDTGQKCPPAPTTSRALMSPLTIQPSPVRSMESKGTPSRMRATTPRQIFVKLAAQDAVADGPTVVDVNLGFVDAAQAKAGDRLQKRALARRPRNRCPALRVPAA